MISLSFDASSLIFNAYVYGGISGGINNLFRCPNNPIQCNHFHSYPQSSSSNFTGDGSTNGPEISRLYM